MRKAILLLSTVAFIFLVSCSKDDPAPIVNEVTFDGEVYTTSGGLILDSGTQGGTHYNYNFYVTDGEISLNGNTLEISASTNFYVYASLVSVGPDSFTPGNFEYTTSFQLIDKNIFVAPVIYVRGESGFDSTLGTGGTITVSGSGPNYTVTYDITFGSKILKGTYSGTFDIQDSPQ